MNARAKLTRPYRVYLASYDTDVTIPAGEEFELYGQLRTVFIGMYPHPQYGDVIVDTTHAEKILTAL